MSGREENIATDDVDFFDGAPEPRRVLLPRADRQTSASTAKTMEQKIQEKCGSQAGTEVGKSHEVSNCARATADAQSTLVAFEDKIQKKASSADNSVARSITSWGRTTEPPPPVPPGMMHFEDEDDEASKKIRNVDNSVARNITSGGRTTEPPPPVPPGMMHFEDEDDEASKKIRSMVPDLLPAVPLLSADGKQSPTKPPVQSPRTPHGPTSEIVRVELPKRSESESLSMTRPTPRSMLTSPLDRPAASKEPSVPVLEATLVEEKPEVKIYDAVEVRNIDIEPPRSWRQRNQKCIYAGLGLLFGGAVAAGTAVAMTRSGSEEESLSIAASLPSSESVAPSSNPSQRPSTLPSSSSYPSHSPTETPSSMPSSSIFPSTSTRPSACFGVGDINIFTDAYPGETSWTISRVTTIESTNSFGTINQNSDSCSLINGAVICTEVLFEGLPDSEASFAEYTEEVCLDRGDYEFTIYDSCGDGTGKYSFTLDGILIAQGGEFESSSTVSFSLPFRSHAPSTSFPPSPLPSLIPSNKPSKSFAPSTSLYPSSQPSYSVAPSTSLHPSLRPSLSSRPSCQECNVTIGMALGEWDQGPFSGKISDADGVLELSGSASRVGNMVISKEWFNLQGSTVYFKWKPGASVESYSHFDPGMLGINGFTIGGRFSTGYSYFDSTLVDSSDWIYTMTNCNGAGDQCTTLTASDNYADQGGTVIRSESRSLTVLQQEVFQASCIYYYFTSNFGGTDQSALLQEVKIANATVVEKPVFSRSLYGGEITIPTAFKIENEGAVGGEPGERQLQDPCRDDDPSCSSWASVGECANNPGFMASFCRKSCGVCILNMTSTCLWETENSEQEGNVIKGTFFDSHVGGCSLGTDINNVRGVSFSMKTEVLGNEYAEILVRYSNGDPNDNLLKSGSSSGWKQYWMPTAKSASSLEWSLGEIGSTDFKGVERLWLKDVKVWFDEMPPPVSSTPNAPQSLRPSNQPSKSFAPSPRFLGGR